MERRRFLPPYREHDVSYNQYDLDRSGVFVRG